MFVVLRFSYPSWSISTFTRSDTSIFVYRNLQSNWEKLAGLIFISWIRSSPPPIPVFRIAACNALANSDRLRTAGCRTNDRKQPSLVRNGTNAQPNRLAGYGYEATPLAFGGMPLVFVPVVQCIEMRACIARCSSEAEAQELN